LAHLILPKILNLPDKLLPLADPDVFNKYQYFIIKGGRGGGKSQSVGRLILYLSEKYRLRVVCGRETQNSISESVYSLHADLIREFQLNYDIQASKITSRTTGSTINYRGFRDQGAFNTQGLEGVDLVHIDESQAITKLTLDVLIPTIRKPNSKIIFTMNPHVFNDPVIVMLAKRPDCLVIDINYDENPHCPTKLINEANECRKMSESDYRHIWLGEPLQQSENSVYSMDDIVNGQNHAHQLAAGYGIRLAGFDVARFGDDKSAAVVIQQMGALHWSEQFVDEWGQADLNYTTGRILMISNQQGADASIVDEDGLGGGPLDTLSKGRELDYFKGFRNLPYGFDTNRYYGNVRTSNAFKLKELLSSGHLCLRDPKLIEELLTCFKYTFDHYQRRILIPKDMMKTKFKVKSPNKADALIMAVSLIGQVKEKQNRQYEPQVAQYGKDDNLFNIAGVR
jgi:hypothetical protein